MTRGITAGVVSSAPLAGSSSTYRRHLSAAETMSTPTITSRCVTRNKSNTCINKNNKQQNNNHPYHISTSSSSTTSSQDTDLESPTKRYKGMVMQTPYTNMTNHPGASVIKSPRCLLGEEPLANTSRVIIDTTLVDDHDSLRASADATATAVSSLSGYGRGCDESSIASDCQTDVSSVAHLRGWLDDFGKQQKKHYEKTTAKFGQAPDDAQRPTRPKTGKTKETANHRPTPLPPPAASALAKRLVDTGLPLRSRATPIRIQVPKKQEPDVRATNEGYKSVKELSAWLADDPTKSKKAKVKCLRRGANVIAKSRVFDKGLANVIIEQDYGGVTGLVAASKRQLNLIPSTDEVVTSTDSRSLADDSVETTPELTTESHKNAVCGWPEPTETASAVSVSDKKQWLANAFKGANTTKEDASLLAAGPKAQTQVVTAQDEREAISNRAKHMWRQQRSQNKAVINNHTNNKQLKSGGVTTESKIGSKNDPIIIVEDTAAEDDPASHGFSTARDLLVKRSVQNGNPVDVSNKKVQSRTAKFEKLEKEARRKSQPMGNLKTAWVETTTDTPAQTNERPRNSYVRTLVSNTAPKKSFDELP